jgi:hypothetical protein
VDGAILRAVVPVRGRAIKRTHVGGADYVYELAVEQPGSPEQRVTMTETLSPRVAAANHDGRAFEALWNPNHPTLFATMTFTVTEQDLERGEAARG